jgi:hypothetical protein
MDLEKELLLGMGVAVAIGDSWKLAVVDPLNGSM